MLEQQLIDAGYQPEQGEYFCNFVLHQNTCDGIHFCVKVCITNLTIEAVFFYNDYNKGRFITMQKLYDCIEPLCDFSHIIEKRLYLSMTAKEYNQLRQ